jgi:hypothetical protein
VLGLVAQRIAHAGSKRSGTDGPGNCPLSTLCQFDHGCPVNHSRRPRENRRAWPCWTSGTNLGCVRDAREREEQLRYWVLGLDDETLQEFP